MNIPPPSETQARIMWLALTGLALALLAGLTAGLVWGLGQIVRILGPVLWPIAVAGILAYLLDPVVDFLEAKKQPRSRAIISVFAAALLLVALLFGSVVPQIVTETRQLAARIPAYAAQAEKRVEHWLSHPPAWAKMLLDRGEPALPTGTDPGQSAGMSNSVASAAPSGIAAGQGGDASPAAKGMVDQRTLDKVTKYLADSAPKVGSWLFGQVGRVASWFGILAGLALIPVYTFYFLLEKKGISSRWSDYLPVADSSFKNELVFVLSSINNYLIAFFRGQVLVAICDGILYGLGFLMVGLPYAVLIGAMAVFLTMIPYLGAIVTCVTALVIAAVQFGDWLHPLLVLAVFACVQTLEGLVISPKIMGGRVGLHPVTIIIAVMAGTTLLGGLLGGILAIPLTAALRVIMLRYVWKRAPTGGAQ